MQISLRNFKFFGMKVLWHEGALGCAVLLYFIGDVQRLLGCKICPGPSLGLRPGVGVAWYPMVKFCPVAPLYKPRRQTDGA